jgi:hypothetical protein
VPRSPQIAADATRWSLRLQPGRAVLRDDARASGAMMADGPLAPSLAPSALRRFERKRSTDRDLGALDQVRNLGTTLLWQR